MADPILHIKDAYFFEVPKALWTSKRASVGDFPDAWIKNDPDFQRWEAERLYHSLADDGVKLPPEHDALHDWEHWQHDDHANFAKPFDQFLLEQAAVKDSPFAAAGQWALDAKHAKDWSDAKAVAGQLRGATGYVAQAKWSPAKLDAYNYHLSGKIVIPQVFGGELRNLHEAESGLCISKFMLVEAGVGLVLVLLFSWLARKVTAGSAPKGRLWNLLEVFVCFIRDEIAKPAIGGHHDDHGHDDHGPAEHGHGDHGHSHAAHGHHDDHGHAHGKAKAHHPDPATQYTPILCTIFFFILGCNLCGMLPWIGAPTGMWAVTFALAMVTLATVFIGGMRQFGFIGFFVNQVPSMDLAWPIAMVLKPALFVIEFGGLLIKHAVLSVRLLANMVAGHMVLLAIMGLAFGAHAAAIYTHDGVVSPMWWVSSTAAVVGCTLLSLLELFVAFLQAYVFTLLSALFIGASIHKH